MELIKLAYVYLMNRLLASYMNPADTICKWQLSFQPGNESKSQVSSRPAVQLQHPFVSSLTLSVFLHLCICHLSSELHQSQCLQFPVKHFQKLQLIFLMPALFFPHVPFYITYCYFNARSYIRMRYHGRLATTLSRINWFDSLVRHSIKISCRDTFQCLFLSSSNIGHHLDWRVSMSLILDVSNLLNL